MLRSSRGTKFGILVKDSVTDGPQLPLGWNIYLICNCDNVNYLGWEINDYVDDDDDDDDDEDYYYYYFYYYCYYYCRCYYHCYYHYHLCSVKRIRFPVSYLQIL